MRREIFPETARMQATGNRRERRQSISGLVDVRSGALAWRRSRLTDLSLHGFKLSYLPNATVGLQITVRIRSLAPLRATVRYIDPDGIGCEFSQPLSPYVLEHLLKR